MKSIEYYKDELERFITENIAMFSYSYHKFYAYVKMCIEANWPKYAKSWSDFVNGEDVAFLEVSRRLLEGILTTKVVEVLETLHLVRVGCLGLVS